MLKNPFGLGNGSQIEFATDDCSSGEWNDGQSYDQGSMHGFWASSLSSVCFGGIPTPIGTASF